MANEDGAVVERTRSVPAPDGMPRPPGMALLFPSDDLCPPLVNAWSHRAVPLAFMLSVVSPRALGDAHACVAAAEQCARGSGGDGNDTAALGAAAAARRPADDAMAARHPGWGLNVVGMCAVRLAALWNSEADAWNRSGGRVVSSLASAGRPLLQEQPSPTLVSRPSLRSRYSRRSRRWTCYYAAP